MVAEIKHRYEAPLKKIFDEIMLNTVIPIAYALVAFAFLLSFWRLLAAPTRPTASSALDTLYVNTIALLVLLGIHLGSADLFRGRAADRDDGLRRHRGAVQVPAARRHHRMRPDSHDRHPALPADPHRRDLHLHRLARPRPPARLLHPPARPHQGHHARRRLPADRLRRLFQRARATASACTRCWSRCSSSSPRRSPPTCSPRRRCT